MSHRHARGVAHAPGTPRPEQADEENAADSRTYLDLTERTKE
jgi:hypothetical protein